MYQFPGFVRTAIITPIYSVQYCSSRVSKPLKKSQVVTDALNHKVAVVHKVGANGFTAKWTSM